MSVKQVAIDVANKRVQFTLNTLAQSITLYPKNQNGGVITLHNDDKITVEFVQKNELGVILYKGAFESLYRVFQSLYKNYSEDYTILPFSLENNVLLTDDSTIVVTIEFGAAVPTSFGYAVNQMLTDVANPISIKKVHVELEDDVDTEFYPVMLLPESVEKAESVLLVQNSTGVMEARKIELTMPLMRSVSDAGTPYVKFITKPNQKVKVTGTADVYLFKP